MQSMLFKGLANMAGVNVKPPVDTNEQKIAKLAIQIRQQMLAEEKKQIEDEQTCIGLYSHWFYSLLALIESAFRLAFHIVVVTLLIIFRYVIYCVSCGKSDVNIALDHQMSRCSLYSGLFMAMIGNLVTPWKPSLYMYPKSSTLCKPIVRSGIHTQDNFTSTLDVESACANVCCCCCKSMCGFKNGFCPCCGNPPESALPAYKLVQVSLSTVGCCSEGTGWYKCVGGEEQTKKIMELQVEVSKETQEATKKFYCTNYEVSSFEELVARDIYHQQQQPNIQPSAPVLVEQVQMTDQTISKQIQIPQNNAYAQAHQANAHASAVPLVQATRIA